jgi:hypothetical protein
MRLEELRSDATVLGMLPDCAVAVVRVPWFGSEALEPTYKDPGARVGNLLLDRHDEPRLEAAEAGRPWCSGAWSWRRSA